MMLDEVLDKYCYLSKEEEWRIRDDAPDEAKELFRNFMSDEPDENGIVTEY